MSEKQPYRVTFTDPVKSRLRVLLRRAAGTGVEARLHAALLRVERELIDDPFGWGDPKWRLRRAEVGVFHRIHDELLVEYAVHTREPIVWVTGITPVLGHPLRGPDDD